MVTLSRPLRAAVPRMIPSTTPGFCSTATPAPQASTISWVRSRNSAHVQAHERAGHHAEVRERGIASADAGQAGENVAEVIGLGDLLHFRAGIGDGDEAAAGFIRADSLLCTFEKVLLENIGLERGAGFAGNDEESFCQIDFVFGCLDLRRIGGIEHVQLREACDLAEGLRQHSGHRLDPPMPSNRMSVKPSFLASATAALELVAVGDLLVDDVEPAQPLGFVRAGPERGVVLPEAADFVARAPIVDVRLYRGRQGLGQFVGLQTYFRTHLGFELFSTAARSLSKASEKRLTPSSVSLSVTSFIEMPTLAAVSMVLWAASTDLRSGSGAGLP